MLNKEQLRKQPGLFLTSSFIILSRISMICFYLFYQFFSSIYSMSLGDTLTLLWKASYGWGMIIKLSIERNIW